MLFIDNVSYSLTNGTHLKLLIAYLESINEIIPRFCYHNKLSTSGNCRMCLVELEGSAKPVVSCCTLLTSNMVIFTDTFLLRRSREFILEFLLMNHPLDCPICDQAGECDLQDLTLVYGSDNSKFSYSKKSILNKNVGPFIKTQMNRCIYCTRCVRYSYELNNTYTFNTLGRSGYSEIGSYFFNSDMNNSYVHGNVIDLCPVGALTAKPNTFRNRPWEYISIDSIDILDSLCSNIRIDVRNNVVERILPKSNDLLNEEWISDKIRFCYDGFKKQRLCLPLYKKNVNKFFFFIITSWYLVFSKIKLNYYSYYTKYFNNTFFHFFTGNLLDLYTIHLLKSASLYFGFTNLNVNLNYNIDLKKYFIFNTTVSSFDIHNVYLIMGTNPKIDSPVLNMKIKHFKYKFNSKIKLGYIGSRILINYSLLHIGLDNKSLLSLYYGKSFFCKAIKNTYNILCLFSHGINYLTNSLFFSMFNMLSSRLKNQSFICNLLSLFSNDVNVSDLGILSYYYSKSAYIHKTTSSFFYLLGVDFKGFCIPKCSFVVYQGHHGDLGTSTANVILPSNLYIENTSFFLNCEGRFFVSNISINKIKKIKNDSNILYNFFIYLFNSKFNYYINVISSFFYKMSYFFKKQQYNKLLFLSSSFLIKMWLFSSFVAIKHSFFSMDVISKHSFYISKNATSFYKKFNNTYVY